MDQDQPTMLRVAVTTNVPIDNFERLYPEPKLGAGGCQFTFNPPDDFECDYWIAWVGFNKRTRLRVAPCNTLFIAGEPPAKKIYPKGYYAQYEQVVSAKANYPHPRVHFDALGLNWHVGYNRHTGDYAYGYDHLTALAEPDQLQNKISVICSDLTTTQGQRDRLALLAALKDHFGDRIDHFGRGFKPIEDKLDAILGYRYHLVLENSISDDYWTEKLIDAYLGWSYPLYVGCENLDTYLPGDSFLPLAGLSASQMIPRIQTLLDDGLNQTQHAAMGRARDAVLNEYNPIARLGMWAQRFYKPGQPSQPVVMQSHKAFRSYGRGHLYRLRERLKSTD